MDISVRTQNLFIFISLVKLIHSHRKYSRKNFFRWRFPKCMAQIITWEDLPLSFYQWFLNPKCSHTLPVCISYQHITCSLLC